MEEGLPDGIPERRRSSVAQQRRQVAPRKLCESPGNTADACFRSEADALSPQRMTEDDSVHGATSAEPTPAVLSAAGAVVIRHDVA